MNKKENKKPKKGYWYKFYEEECVLCGRYSVTKERQYTPKPESYLDRYVRREYACSGHFL
jgi:hypothetical protein